MNRSMAEPQTILRRARKHLPKDTPFTPADARWLATLISNAGSPGDPETQTTNQHLGDNEDSP